MTRQPRPGGLVPRGKSAGLQPPSGGSKAPSRPDLPAWAVIAPVVGDSVTAQQAVAVLERAGWTLVPPGSRKARPAAPERPIDLSRLDDEE